MTSKPIKIKYSKIFNIELQKLQEAVNQDKDNKFYKQLLNAIEREKSNLLINPHRGIQVYKRKIPKEYVEKYNIKNLWKINLPGYWRMVYTITGNELEI